MKETSGEEIIRYFLKKRRIKFEPEKVIEGLKGDSKSFRRADFYLYDYNVYIEYLGTWDNPDYDKRISYQVDNSKKIKVYKENNINCIFILPRHLKSIEYVLTKELKKYSRLKKPKEIKPKSTIRQKSTPERPSKKNNLIKWFLVIGLGVFILFFIFGNINQNRIRSSQQGKKSTNELLYESLNKLYSDSFIGMNGKEFRTLIFNRGYQWDPRGETKDLSVFQHPQYVLRVYFNGIVQKQENSTNCNDIFGIDSAGNKVCGTSLIFTDAKLSKVEMYVNNTKIKEKGTKI